MVETQRLSPPAAKEASLAKDVSPVVATATADAKASKPHKPKLLARQRNNYERPDYYDRLGLCPTIPERATASICQLVTAASGRRDLSIIRLASDDDVIPAFHRRCLCPVILDRTD